MQLLQALALLLGLAYAGARFPGPIAFLDNLSNFPAHFAAAFLACAVVFACLGRVAWTLAALAGLALALAQVLPLYRAAPYSTPPAAQAPVRVLAANVLLHNREHERLVALVEREDPDVV